MPKPEPKKQRDEAQLASMKAMYPLAYFHRKIEEALQKVKKPGEFRP